MQLALPNARTTLKEKKSLSVMLCTFHNNVVYMHNKIENATYKFIGRHSNKKIKFCYFMETAFPFQGSSYKSARLININAFEL